MNFQTNFSAVPASTRPTRSELEESRFKQDPIREFGEWLLWSGLTPASKLPVSQIGIYTDFT